IFPESEGLHVHADGSLTEVSPNIGAGMYSSIFSFYVPVGKPKNVFDEEVIVIYVAPNGATCAFPQDTFAIGIQAAIQAVGSGECPTLETS
ncbi:hypothetical protein TNCT_462231, partial [Trichonephila clavata]